MVVILVLDLAPNSNLELNPVEKSRMGLYVDLCKGRKYILVGSRYRDIQSCLAFSGSVDLSKCRLVYVLE